MKRVRIKAATYMWGGRVWYQGEYELPDDDPALEAMRQDPVAVEVLGDPPTPSEQPQDEAETPTPESTGAMTTGDLARGGRRSSRRRTRR